MATIQENVDLKPFTYFKIGGPTRFFAEVKSEQELREAIRFAKAKRIPFVVFGAASNVLVSDRGYDGLVVRMQLRDIVREENTLTAGAGVSNAVLVARAAVEKLSGFEWAIGIPGTVGGSVRGNAGCFSGEMRDVIESVRFFNAETGEIEEGNNDFCRFGYRESVFKSMPHLVILGARLALRDGSSELGQRLIRYYTSIRSDAQDIGSASAGCVFKNVRWPADDALRQRLLRLLPQLSEFSTRETIPVGFLVDHLGLKGRTIGKVGVSKKHGNYLINHGGATAEEVIMLIGLIKEHIHRKYSLQLEEEIQLVGFD